MHIGLKIKELIVQKTDLNIIDFAKKIGYSEQGLHKILKKKDLSTEIIKKVCEELSISFSDFFAEKKENDYKKVTGLAIVHEEGAVYGVVDYKEKYYEALEKLDNVNNKLNEANERLLAFMDVKKEVIKKGK